MLRRPGLWIGLVMLPCLLTSCGNSTPNRPGDLPEERSVAVDDMGDLVLAEFDEDIALVAQAEDLDTAVVREVVHDYLRSHDFLIAAITGASEAPTEPYPRTDEVYATVERLASRFEIPKDVVARIILTIREGQAGRAAVDTY